MYQINGSFASITDIVQDFMFVEIRNIAILDKTFEYKIVSQDDKLIRKGRFEGPNVQLRLSLMPEGTYFFRLYLNGEELQHISFEKRQGFTGYLMHLKEE